MVEDMKLHLLGPIVLATVLPLAIAAADHDRPHHPPQAAIDACKSAKRGDACSVTFGDHTIKGVCDAPPDHADAPLACRPDGPPPEAISACDGAKAGDACTISHGDHSIQGTCALRPDGNGPLACRPDHPPPSP
jgi:hypothetical protein